MSECSLGGFPELAVAIIYGELIHRHHTKAMSDIAVVKFYFR